MAPVGLLRLDVPRLPSETAMSEVTRMLNLIEEGDPNAADKLLPLVYADLRELAAQHLAQEKPGETLQATALVHEVYVRLAGGDRTPQWNSRGHFFAAAAQAMRRILVEAARRKKRQNRGGGLHRVPNTFGCPEMECNRFLAHGQKKRGLTRIDTGANGDGPAIDIFFFSPRLREFDCGG
jgi:RNA polymerase sigma factor (TIGR02999 family)